MNRNLVAHIFSGFLVASALVVSCGLHPLWTLVGIGVGIIMSTLFNHLKKVEEKG